MQLAILLVLILIAVLIAPWLIGVIIAAAALYGAWVLAVAIIFAAVAAFCVGSAAFKRFASRRRMDSAINKVNRQYRKEKPKGHWPT